MTQITTSWEQIKEVYVGNDSYHDVYWRMYARISSSTSTTSTVQVQGRLYITPSGGSLYMGATSTVGGNVGSVSQWGINIAGTYYPGETTLFDKSDTINNSVGSCTAGVRFYSSPWGWTGENLYLSDTLTFTTVPTTPTISGSYPSSTYNNITYGTTSFGTAGSGTVYLYGGTSSSPTTQINSKTTTGNTTFKHDSLKRNARYYYRARAKSSVGWSSYSSEITGVTRSGASAWSVASFTTTSITISYTTSSGGGEYAQRMQYSLDGGTTWVTGATVAAGTTASETGTFTISGLTQATTYTIQTRVLTTAGSAIGTTLTASTASPPSGGTVYMTSKTWNSISLSGSITSWGSPTNPNVQRIKLGVANASPVSGKPRREISGAYNSKSHSGTINNSSATASGGFTLCGGKVIYPYVWATNGTASAFVYTGSAYTLDIAPMESVQVQTQIYDSASETVSVNILLQGGATNNITNASGLLVKTRYRYKKTSESTWSSWITYQNSDAETELLADTLMKATIQGLSPETEYEVQAQQYEGSIFSQTETLGFTTIERQITPTQYSVELWDWKTGSLVFDLSPYITGNLEMVWVLNDAEEVNFQLDAESFEADWASSPNVANNPLLPYAYDIRIRRNGTYIMGCNLVSIDYNIQNNPPSTLTLKATGYLNLLKDQYVTHAPWYGYTYARISQKLIETCQQPENYIKNWTFDIDTSYWVAGVGTLSYSGSNTHTGNGCARVVGVSGTTTCGIGTQIKNLPLSSVDIDFWVKPVVGTRVRLLAREYITNDTTQRQLVSQAVTSGEWNHITITGRGILFENAWLYIEVVADSGTPEFYLDDVIVSDKNEVDRTDLGITIGTNTAVQSTTPRQVNYDLQNVKDAIMTLSSQGEDNFDFSFTHDRVYKIYNRKGADKLNLFAEYPGNISSVVVQRDASNLANKIIGLGSGIGDERLETQLYERRSRLLYGTHTSVLTKNNVSLGAALNTQTIGELYDRKNPTLLPRIIIEDGSINPENVEVGDSISIKIEKTLSFGEVNDAYRIHKIKTTVSPEMVERMDLTLSPPVQRPTPFMVRYIKDVMYGNTVNTSNHWVEIEALLWTGNEFVNVARGKTATRTDGNTLTNASRVTDGDLSVSKYVSTGSGVGIVVDLGDAYPIDYIRVYHYWADGRKYKGEHLSCGATLESGTTDLGKLLINMGQTSEGYSETANGITSGWIQLSSIQNGGIPI